MPGLSFVYHFQHTSEKIRGQQKAALNSLLHRPEYEQSVFIDETNFFLGATKHPSYPLTLFDDDNFLISLDGVIYDYAGQSLKNQLLELARIVSANSRDVENYLNSWVTETDGEFLLLIRDKAANTVFILNDLLGLLPCYYIYEKDRFIISRDLSFITKLMNEIRFDRYALAMHLMFNCTFSSRSFIKNVHRLPQASLIAINQDSKPFTIKTTYQHNSEDEEYANRNADDNIDALVELFDQACRKRIDHSEGTNIVLGLSGGRDSRAVCLGLIRGKANFDTFTHYFRNNRNPEADLNIAREVAHGFGVKWHKIEIDAPKGADLLELLKVKNGLNNLGLAYMATFLNIICRSFDEPVTYATGDHFAPIKYCLPTKNLKNTSDLANYIINYRGMMALAQASKMVNLKLKDIIDQFIVDLDTLPEKDCNRKFIQFIRSRYFKYLSEGMDRNRCYGWLMTPLTAPPFAFYSLRCSQTQKRGGRLYDGFLKRLSDKTMDFRLADTNAYPESIKMSFKSQLRDYYDANFSPESKQWIKTHVLRNWMTYQSDSAPIKCIKEIFDSCQPVSYYFDPVEIEKTLKWCSRLQLDNLFNLAATIEWLNSQKSVLEHYYDEPFV